MTAVPTGQTKSADVNSDAIVNAAEPKPRAPRTVKPKSFASSEGAVFVAAPLPPTPGEPTPEGVVEYTTPDIENTEVKPVVKRKPLKADPLLSLTDHTKLPVSVSVGSTIISVDSYAGNAVLSLSLVGWVGDPEFKILAQDAGEIEQALAELRELLK
jgi:hypothetical protein